MFENTRRLCLILLTAWTSACYVHTVVPLDQNLDRTQLGTKEGRASTTGILWTFIWGDSGTQAAAKNGGLETINHADLELFVVLGGIYSRATTIVYGD